MIDANHWLLRPIYNSTCSGASVSGSGHGCPQHALPRSLDAFFIRAHFDTAPSEVLVIAVDAIGDILRERTSMQRKW